HSHISSQGPASRERRRSDVHSPRRHLGASDRSTRPRRRDPLPPPRVHRPEPATRGSGRACECATVPACALRAPWPSWLHPQRKLEVSECWQEDPHLECPRPPITRLLGAHGTLRVRNRKQVSANSAQKIRPLDDLCGLVS